MQGGQQKELKAILTRLLQDKSKASPASFVKPSSVRGNYLTLFPPSGFSAPLLLLERQTRVDLPTAVGMRDYGAPSRTAGCLRLLNSRSDELAPLLLSDAAGCMWSLSKERHIRAEVWGRRNSPQEIDKSPATDDSDGDERNELSWIPAICGGFFGGLVGMTLACDSSDPGHLSLLMMAAHASGTVTEWKISAEREKEVLKVSSKLCKCIHTGMPISCLGYTTDCASGSEHRPEENQDQRCLLGFADGTVAWTEDGCVRQRCRCDTATDAERKERTSTAQTTAHLLALQVDGSFFEMLLEPGLLQTPLSRSLLPDRKIHSQAAGNTLRVLPPTTAPVSISTGSFRRIYSPFIITARVDGGPVPVAILGEPGILQLRLLADGTEQPGLHTGCASPHASFKLEFSCTAAPKSGPLSGELLQYSGTREDHNEGPPNLSLSPKKSRLYLKRRISMTPDVQQQLDAILQEKENIKGDLQALLGRVAVTPALRGLEGEAEKVDAAVRLLANQRASASQKEKQQHLLLLQHAFVAFHQNLVQHLQASILTAPKELSIAAENPGETINAKAYLSFRRKPREKALSKKVLFLRKVQRLNTFIVVKNIWAR
ncbi:uncharacterized protein EMH_0023020 [Eimeria mitis]|uniref:Uncharacterized protein n=1 Tax=Eimeria mitis TaxID=44415 RepID=U6JUN9_9EIME|nr:uncharacterized protein EMH_0023020 [Eimeria mitis]CDJ29129.1 hypothetical protein, conserved [Eimeria mitis]